jgi:hypothetical protein
MAQFIRLLGIISFATLISFGLYSQGIVYLCLFLFTLYLVIKNKTIRRVFQAFKLKRYSSSNRKKSGRKMSKTLKRARKLGLTIYSSHSTTIGSEVENVNPKLIVINGKRTR